MFDQLQAINQYIHQNASILACLIASGLFSFSQTGTGKRLAAFAAAAAISVASVQMCRSLLQVGDGGLFVALVSFILIGVFRTWRVERDASPKPCLCVLDFLFALGAALVYASPHPTPGIMMKMCVYSPLYLTATGLYLTWTVNASNPTLLATAANHFRPYAKAARRDSATVAGIHAWPLLRWIGIISLTYLSALGSLHLIRNELIFLLLSGLIFGGSLLFFDKLWRPVVVSYPQRSLQLAAATSFLCACLHMLMFLAWGWRAFIEPDLVPMIIRGAFLYVPVLVILADLEERFEKSPHAWAAKLKDRFPTLDIVSSTSEALHDAWFSEKSSTTMQKTILGLLFFLYFIVPRMESGLIEAGVTSIAGVDTTEALQSFTALADSKAVTAGDPPAFLALLLGNQGIVLLALFWLMALMSQISDAKELRSGRKDTNRIIFGLSLAHLLLIFPAAYVIVLAVPLVCTTVIGNTTFILLGALLFSPFFPRFFAHTLAPFRLLCAVALLATGHELKSPYPDPATPNENAPLDGE